MSGKGKIVPVARSKDAAKLPKKLTKKVKQELAEKPAEKKPAKEMSSSNIARCLSKHCYYWRAPKKLVSEQSEIVVQ